MSIPVLPDYRAPEKPQATFPASPPLSGDLQKSTTVVEKDYEKLRNKPSINGVELIANKSFEELGDHVLTNFEILELMKKAGF